MDVPFEKLLEMNRALWRWKAPQGSYKKKPHALLTSGRHSNGFINISMLLSRPWILSQSCLELVLKIVAEHGGSHANPVNAEWVVGSAVGGIPVAHEMAKFMNARCAFTEKDGNDMVLSRFDIPKGSSVLVVEDVMTTGGTSIKTIAALEKAGCSVIPLIPTLVARFNDYTMSIGGTTFTVPTLAHLVFQDWKPELCPICAKGSPALRPKAHWDEFVPAEIE